MRGQGSECIVKTDRTLNTVRIVEGLAGHINETEDVAYWLL